MAYSARPPIASDRLQELPDGRLALRFKQAWRDGTTHIVCCRRDSVKEGGRLKRLCSLRTEFLRRTAESNRSEVKRRLLVAARAPGLPQAIPSTALRVASRSRLTGTRVASGSFNTAT